MNSDWIQLGGGDGFWCVFDPFDRNVVYAESQEGYVHRIHLGSGQVKNLRPEPTEGQPAFRFHWNSPLVASRHEKGTMFLAGNRVFRVTEKGEKFTPISPDLSTQELTKMTAKGSGAENYGVVYALAESPRKAGLLWAGTDDGKLWVTEDGGGKWTDLTASLPPAAKGQWIARVEASPHDEKVGLSRRLGVPDAETTRHSSTGPPTSAGRGRPSPGTSRRTSRPTSIREDPRNPSLLYAGTEYGFYVSLDRGTTWSKLGDLPTVPVDDVAVHDSDRDLVDRHARPEPLRDRRRDGPGGADAGGRAEGAPPLPAAARAGRTSSRAGRSRPARRSSAGENPKEGALLTFWVKEATADA